MVAAIQGKEKDLQLKQRKTDGDGYLQLRI